MMIVPVAIIAAFIAWVASRRVDRRPGTPQVRRGRWLVHISAALLAAVFAGTAGAVVDDRLAWAPFLYLAVAGVAMGRIDAYELRLPDRLVLPAYPLTAVCFAAAAAVDGRWGTLGRAAVGGVLLWAFYRLLRALRPGELGRGDVKLAGVLGAQLAWLGWGPWQVGAVLSFLLFAVAGLLALAVGRASWRTRQAFGPYVLAGAWVAVSGLAIST